MRYEEASNAVQRYNESVMKKITSADLEKERKQLFIEKLKNRDVLKKATYWDDYYAGADVGIFIGGTWVDDVITIQYTHTNNKSPIYGYMSEEYDAVSKGTRIVQGQFSIAFKETAYLQLILDNYNKKLGVTNQTIEDRLTSNESTAEMAFSDVALGRKELPSPDKWNYTNEKVGGGFDIIITFGDYTEEYRGGTVEILNDVHITSRSIVCEPTGDAIAEIYSFFAKSYNKNIPRSLKESKTAEELLIEDIKAMDNEDLSNAIQQRDLAKQDSIHEVYKKPWYKFWKKKVVSEPIKVSLQ